jgi:ubiquinone biosynthesis protein UbiJ
MLRGPAFNLLNHLLAAEGWAQARLRPFAGQRAHFQFGPFSQTLIVGGDGSLSPCAATPSPDVTVRLPETAVWRLLAAPSSLFASAHISGAADFAETLGFVARHLRWDAEADLARRFGDIPARRLVLVARHIAERSRDTLRRLEANIGESLAERDGPLLTAAEAERLYADARTLDEAVSRIEQRIGALGKS